MPRFFGVDLAWRDSTPARPANETGLAVIDETGTVISAGWERGVAAVSAWLIASAAPGDVVAIDAPLVVTNATGMRQAEREVGSRYGAWHVAANAMNLSKTWQGGVGLRERLEAAGFVYIDGTQEPDPDRVSMFECYPYTTIVGMDELGYDERRPRYKRLDPSISPTEGRVLRAAAGDQLIERMSALDTADPPLALRSHPLSLALVDDDSPLLDAPYKHREDLLDALLCAWTASIWHRHGSTRVQVLGAGAEPDAAGRRPTIVAPARPMQRVADPEPAMSASTTRLGGSGAPPGGSTEVTTDVDAGMMGRVLALAAEVQASDEQRLEPAVRSELAELSARIVRRLAVEH